MERNSSASSARRTFAAAVYLLALALLSERMPAMSKPLAVLAGLSLFLSFVLVFRRPGSGSGLRSKLAGPAAFLAGAAIVVLGRGRYAGLLGGLTMLAVLWLSVRTDPDARAAGDGAQNLKIRENLEIREKTENAHYAAARGELAALSLATALFLIYVALLDHVPWIWSFTESVSTALSRGAAAAIGREARLSAAYSGLSLVVLFGCYLAGTWVFSKPRRAAFLGYSAAGLVSAFAAYLVAWPLLAGSSLSTRLALVRPFLPARDFWPVLFALLAIAAWLVTRRIKLEAPPRSPMTLAQSKLSTTAVRSSVKPASPSSPTLPPSRRTAWKFLAPALALVLAAGFLLALPSVGQRASDKVVFFDPTGLDWTAPSYERLGLRNLGMFGSLPVYLRDTGFDTKVVGRLRPGELDGRGTVVLINLGRPLDDRETRAIWEHVRRGGGLLVMGDHTGVEIVREPYNKLLERVGISFRFDSTVPANERWGHGLELRPHPLFKGIRAEETQVNIGASLAVSGRARPLVVGEDGFSDAGDRGAPEKGYLGDMRYAAEERLGDLVLVAEAGYGSGRVLAFGDTTTFQNGSLPYSHRFVDNVFAWMGSGARVEPFPMRVPLVLLLLAASLVLLTAARRQYRERGLSPLCIFEPGRALLVGTAFCVGLLTASAFAGAPASGVEVKRAALIDVSHSERTSTRPLDEEGLDGLAAALARQGYHPVVSREISQDALRGADVLAIQAPAARFSKGELDAIDRFVSRGGLLLLAAGFEEYDGARGVFERFGLRVAGVPLGRLNDGGSGGPQVWEAWPVEVEAGSGARTLVGAWDYPVIVSLRHGSGRVIAAGDSSFFTNRNLETVDGALEANVDFLRGCLDGRD